MKINNKILMIAIILGLITSGILYYYIKDMKTVQAKPIETTRVVTAVNTIPIHTKITADMLTTISIPTDEVHPDAVLDITAVVNGISNAEIIKGEQLLVSRVISDTTNAPLSYRIPENMRAITIPIDEVSGVAGYIAAGDKIDIIVFYTDVAINPTKSVYTQLQNVEVLEKGAYETAITEGQTTTEISLTLLVSPADAQMITYAKMNGKISCSLRNIIDNSIAK